MKKKYSKNKMESNFINNLRLTDREKEEYAKADKRI